MAYSGGILFAFVVGLAPWSVAAIKQPLFGAQPAFGAPLQPSPPKPAERVPVKQQVKRFLTFMDYFPNTNASDSVRGFLQSDTTRTFIKAIDSLLYYEPYHFIPQGGVACMEGPKMYLTEMLARYAGPDSNLRWGFENATIKNGTCVDMGYNLGPAPNTCFPRSFLYTSFNHIFDTAYNDDRLIHHGRLYKKAHPEWAFPAETNERGAMRESSHIDGDCMAFDFPELSANETDRIIEAVGALIR